MATLSRFLYWGKKDNTIIQPCETTIIRYFFIFKYAMVCCYACLLWVFFLGGVFLQCISSIMSGFSCMLRLHESSSAWFLKVVDDL